MLDPKLIKPYDEVMKQNTQSWNIEDAFALFQVYQDRIKKTWMLWEKSLYPVLDQYTKWIIQWKAYTIWAFSNIWKSRFAYSYVQDFIKKWKKVLFFSLEVDIWMLIGHIAWSYYWIKFEELQSHWINKSDFNNLRLYDKIYKMDEIIRITEDEKPDVIFIDYLQSVQDKSWSEYERITNIAIEIQQLAIRNNITVFSLSQVNNDSRFKDWENITLKWSWQIFASSDVIFILNKDSWLLNITIAKNKFWPALKKFSVNANFSISKFLITEIQEDNIPLQ
jgi:replicative DNA helicase